MIQLLKTIHDFSNNIINFCDGKYCTCEKLSATGSTWKANRRLFQQMFEFQMTHCRVG